MVTSKSPVSENRKPAGRASSNVYPLSVPGNAHSRSELADIEPATTDAGLYCWNLLDNIVRADAAVAELFGFDRLEAERGLPAQAFISRIMQQDRHRVADAIKRALLLNTGYQENYTVTRPDGSTVEVAGYAHVFRDENGEPTSWIGIVHPASQMSGANVAISHCLAAYAAAKAAGMNFAAERILEVVVLIRKS